MARPKTPDEILEFIFERTVAGAKSKEVVTEVQDKFNYLVSASLVADMRNGWTHTEMGAKYGIEAKTRRVKVIAEAPESLDTIESADKDFSDEVVA